MYRSLAAFGLSLSVLVGVATTASAEETRIDVRVISKGAKFIGSSMGGVAITIEDAHTGQHLAQGKTVGSTGDTEKIMRTRLPHHAPVSTKDAAVFSTTLDLDEPQKMKVVARGPLSQPQAMATATVTQWVVPGKHITGGDGLMLELPGFVVDVLSPPAHKTTVQSSEPIKLTANVIMMCGCPIEPDGLWDATLFEVIAIVKRDGKKIDETPLSYAGKTSQFTTDLNIKKSGTYEITVFAFDSANGNTGLDKTTIVVQ